jgi:membrane protein YqaA with SNARE-associated domain
MIESAVVWVLHILALPAVGLSSVFVVSFISATLLPLASEPAVFAVIKSNSALLWPAILAATAGNALGGAVDYWMGFGAKKAISEQATQQRGTRWFRGLEGFGPKVLLLSWLPLIGDPLCVLAGWLKWPFWPCFAYMAVGKGVRYIALTWILLWIPDGIWHQIGAWLG